MSFFKKLFRPGRQGGADSKDNFVLELGMVFLKKLRYRYHIEEFGYAHVSGWAIDRRTDKPCRVCIRTISGTVVAEGMTGIVRADRGGRGCGFRLPLDAGVVKLLPQRFLVYVDGVKVANCHVVVPLASDAVFALMEEGREAFLAIKTERLERELEDATRRLAQLELMVGQAPAREA
jgi:hypothetical protein